MQAAAESLAQALARNDSNAEIAIEIEIEKLAIDPNSKVKCLCSTALFLAAAQYNSEKAKELIKGFATRIHGTDFHKVATQALLRPLSKCAHASLTLGLVYGSHVRILSNAAQIGP